MNTYDFNTDVITYKDHKIENFFGSFTQQKYMVDYVKENLIMLCVGGSHAYGLDTETSDVDVRGIFKDSIDMVLGFEKIDQLSNESNDITIFSLTKALKLIADCNPNMMELLWIDKEEIFYATNEYWLIRDRRDELLSKLAKHKYAGYAMSQMNRIKGHDKWLVKEKSGKFNVKPNIKDYILYIDKYDGSVMPYDKLFNVFPEYYVHLYFTKVKNEIYNVWENNLKTYPLIEDGNSFIPIQETHDSLDQYVGVIWFNKSQFQLDLEEYNNWKRWKENRNETRHELEEKFGYDTKHAMHTIRLLKMGLEILDGKGVIVKRPDRDELLDIRAGGWSYEQILSRAENFDKNILENAYKDSKLRNAVDQKVVLDMIKEILWIR